MPGSILHHRAALAVALSSGAFAIAFAVPPAPTAHADEPAAATTSTVRHDFGTEPAAPWRWVRGSEGGWRLRDGALEIRAQAGRVWGGNDAGDILVLGDPPAGGHTAAVDVALQSPESKYEQGGLLAYRGDDAFVKLVVEHIDGEFFIVLAREADGENHVITKEAIPAPAARLELTADGPVARARYRLPDGGWQPAGECELGDAAGGRFALFTQDGPRDESRWVRFDNFTLDPAAGQPGPATTTAATGNPDRLRVVAYNIRHGAGMHDDTVDLSRAAAVLRRIGADLVALQEVDRNCTRSGGVDQAAALGKELGMAHAFGEFMEFQGGGYGLAVLSRFPIVERHVHRLPDGAEPRVALEVQVDVPALGRVSFVSVHHDWTDTSFRTRQVEALTAALASRDHPVILAGDFNATLDGPSMRPFAAAPWTPLPKSGAASATWPADEPRVEIDHVIVRGFGSAAAATCRVDSEAHASDHRPVVADLPLPKAPGS